MKKRVCLYCNRTIGCSKNDSCESCSLSQGKKIDCKFAFVNKLDKIAGMCSECKTRHIEAIEDQYEAQWQ